MTSSPRTTTSDELLTRTRQKHWQLRNQLQQDDADAERDIKRAPPKASSSNHFRISPSSGMWEFKPPGGSDVTGGATHGRHHPARSGRSRRRRQQDSFSSVLPSSPHSPAANGAGGDVSHPNEYREVTHEGGEEGRTKDAGGMLAEEGGGGAEGRDGDTAGGGGSGCDLPTITKTRLSRLR
ncbi:unnamed protein product [Zymoseptoria tritici ST99CH_3D1]|uniref:Uncharacterized protein n=1 Tax=Zymoseptoria tritici (strain CBS 115943 / IPO323) TaxID=336722 RepID=F9XS40_ZYMTI|nr:uncharacterized protein MYCGRDRAFT_98029 [Zymoseptoria tritici IPO323]EGP81901.1 hypothetical protein MYCGRDRAFT_98029 [Zymoseptoria tritici IPO323]SMR65128.1 unnamed protein product [Zymoseptoria tritici ST99CH_3D1]